MPAFKRISACTTLFFSLFCSSILEADPDYNTRIIRDNYGVPHIYGKTFNALWYGVGYAQAQDRMWQADLLRRNINGTSAELLGPVAIQGDIFARTTFGSQQAREAMLNEASEKTQAQFKAYADGFNAWIQEAINTGNLPVEYLANGLTPEPWTISDSVAVLQLIFLQFGEDGSDELTNAFNLQSLLQRFGLEDGQKIFSDTHWLNDADAYTTVPARRDRKSGTTKHKGKRSGKHHNKHHRYDELKKGWKRNLKRLGITGNAASNAIAISPKLSTDGHALLFGAPQMGFSVPQIALEMSIHNAALNVNGISFAGIPGISIGVTRHFSWSFTSGVSDNVDLYMDSVAELNCRNETINVRGSSPVVVPVCESKHGPAVAIDNDAGIAYTLKSAVRGRMMTSFEALQSAQYAKNIKQIDQAMRHWAPNFNMLIATKSGDIAYRHLGFIPVRHPDDTPWLPHNGDGTNEWTGFVDWDDLPKTTNPKQGWLVNWNNKPSADWNNSSRRIGSFGPVQRVDAMVSQLKSLPDGTVSTETLADINRTTMFTAQTPSHNPVAVFVPKLLSLMLKHLDMDTDPRLKSVAKHLKGWDHLQIDKDVNGFYDDPAVTIFNTWFKTFTQNTFADELGTLFESGLVANLTYRTINPDVSLPLQYDYLSGINISVAITAALIQSIDSLTLQYASADMVNWLQPTRLLAWSPQGAIDFIPDSPWMNRGTYTQIIHMGRGKERYGMNVVAPGQSGNPFSPHAIDQLELFVNTTYKPMLLTKRQQKQNQESVIKLNYEQ